MSSRIAPEIRKQSLQAGSITNKMPSNPETSFANTLSRSKRQTSKSLSLSAIRNLAQITSV